MQNSPRQSFHIAIAVVILLVTAYILLNLFSILPEELNDRVTTVLYSILAPGLSGLAIGLVLKEMGTSAGVGRAWLAFSIGIWLWVLAEFTWAGYYFATGEWPDLSASDVLWLLGFIGLTIALKIQYELINQNQVPWWRIIAIWTGVLVATLLVVVVTGAEINFSNYLAYFWPVADLATGFFAMRLFLHFRGGLFSRPWAGLLVMGLADAIYALLEATGVYDQASESEGLLGFLPLAADSTYMAAYLVLALGFFMIYLVLRYGPEAFIRSPAE